MSVRVMELVFKNFSGDGRRNIKFMLLALADCAHDDGSHVYPSLENLAEKTSCSVKQARREVHQLVVLGFLTLMGNKYGGRPGSTVQYRINLDRLTPPIDGSPTPPIHRSPTAPVHVPDPSRTCPSTPPMDGSLTVIEPSGTVSTLQRRFSEFWAAYPKRINRGLAEKAFSSLRPDDQLLKMILAGVERAKASDDWRKEGGKYVPYAEKWLKAKGWLDEHAASPVRRAVV